MKARAACSAAGDGKPGDETGKGDTMTRIDRRGSLAIAAFATAALLGSAAAQAAEISVSTALSQGYNIVATALLPTGQLQKLGQQNPSPQLLVTMQRGNSVAVCTVAVGDWEYLNDNAVNTASSCDVH